MNAPLLAGIGDAIDRLARAILRAVYGLRIPAARVRLHDRLEYRHFALQQMARASNDFSFWSGEAARCEIGVEEAKHDLWKMTERARSA